MKMKENKIYWVMIALFVSMAFVTVASKASCFICLQTTCSTAAQCGAGCICITEPYDLEGECYRAP